MATVSVRDLRNNGAEVLGRVESGESLDVTRDGRPVARLTPLARPGIRSAELLLRARRLPAIDAARFRSDIDEVVDQSW